jgi:hypothetical protein
MNNKIIRLAAASICIAATIPQQTQASPFPDREGSLFCLDFDRYCRATSWSDGYQQRNGFRKVSVRPSNGFRQVAVRPSNGFRQVAGRPSTVVVMTRSFLCSYIHVRVDESIDQKVSIFSRIASILFCLAGFVRANLIFLDYYRYSVLPDLNTFSNLSSLQLAQI